MVRKRKSKRKVRPVYYVDIPKKAQAFGTAWVILTLIISIVIYLLCLQPIDRFALLG